MKYVRTKDGRIIEYLLNGVLSEYDFVGTDKSADTIAELCDEFVCQENDNFYWLASRENVSFRDLPNCYCKAIYGAIWTDKGLIYVAKMNEKGELELL